MTEDDTIFSIPFFRGEKSLIPIQRIAKKPLVFITGYLRSYYTQILWRGFLVTLYNFNNHVPDVSFISVTGICPAEEMISLLLGLTQVSLHFIKSLKLTPL